MPAPFTFPGTWLTLAQGGKGKRYRIPPIVLAVRRATTARPKIFGLQEGPPLHKKGRWDRNDSTSMTNSLRGPPRPGPQKRERPSDSARDFVTADSWEENGVVQGRRQSSMFFARFKLHRERRTSMCVCGPPVGIDRFFFFFFFLWLGVLPLFRSCGVYQRERTTSWTGCLPRTPVTSFRHRTVKSYSRIRQHAAEAERESSGPKTFCASLERFAWLGLGLEDLDVCHPPLRNICTIHVCMGETFCEGAQITIFVSIRFRSNDSWEARVPTHTPTSPDVETAAQRNENILK